MAGFNGFGGANMQQLIKQAQKMQADLSRKKEELDDSIFYSSTGNGLVEVKMNGKREVLAIKIKPEIVDPDDVEMLEDLITAGVNDCNNQINEKAEELTPNMPGGLF